LCVTRIWLAQVRKVVNHLDTFRSQRDGMDALMTQISSSIGKHDRGRTRPGLRRAARPRNVPGLRLSFGLARG
jgi:hypothetical protein